MTLLASWIGRDRALIATDTRITGLQTSSEAGTCAAYDPVPGALVEGSKLLALPHARLVLAHAGSMHFLASTFLRCQQVIGPGGFDELDDLLPDVLDFAFRQVLDMRRLHFPDVPEGEVRGQQLMMAGWSQGRGRMCGVLFNQSPLQEGFQRQPLAGFGDDEDERGSRFASPWLPVSGPLPYASTPAAMEYLARRQMHDLPSAAAAKSGGRLLVAELTRDSVSVTSRCDLEAGSTGR